MTALAQLDLFTQPLLPSRAAPREDDSDHLGWERRALEDLTAEPLVYCFPGFMGTVCERLVSKGLATREPAGFLDPPAGMTARQLNKWGWKSEDHPRFRYTLTAAGRANLAPAMADA